MGTTQDVTQKQTEAFRRTQMRNELYVEKLTELIKVDNLVSSQLTVTNFKESSNILRSIREGPELGLSRQDVDGTQYL